MTKLAHLKSIGHNIADSLSSGMGMMIGFYETDVYGEAAASEEGYVDVDFLSGNTSGGTVSASLAGAVKLYSKELPVLCEKHGVEATEFRKLSVRFLTNGLWSTCVVTVEDQFGRVSVDEYRGTPTARVKTIDYLGRVRRK